MKRFILCACARLGIVVTAASGHPGPRIWISIDDGKVTTYAGPYPPGDPVDYHPSLVFTQPLGDEEDIWFTEFPGYQIVPGGEITTGTMFYYNIAGPALWYNPGDASRAPFFEPVQDHFINSPPVPQFAVNNELFQITYTSTGLVSGDLAFTYHGNAGDHNHLTYTLLGDGVNAGGGQDGIYALPLQLTASGHAPSDTFYLLLGKNAAPCELAIAASVMLTGRPLPDYDCDLDVDADDLVLFETCRTGPTIPLPPPGAGLEHCIRADFDGDGDVDQSDFGVIQRCLSGPGEAPVLHCAQ